jgi:pimeloyl-ACP methyl ester carboxylesterase
MGRPREDDQEGGPPARRRTHKPLLRVITDGPFAETKELVMGSWPASLGRYAAVNGLRMYHEVHGKRDGRPLVLLHGAMTNIETLFRRVVSTLASDGRRVIAIEHQAHGRTADIDRRQSAEQMADDTAELLRQLDVREADFFAFSAGGSAALQIALQHPGLARKLAIVSSGYGAAAYRPDIWRSLESMIEHPAADAMKREFQRHAARPGQWSHAWQRTREVYESQQAASQEHLRRICADTLFVTAETGMWPRRHSYELAGLIPGARVVSFAGDDHDPHIINHAAALLPAFLL